MDLISASSTKHIPFFTEERAQLVLLRILGKASISLQIQDNIIDWACHYSLVNKLHNGGGDFWIRHTFPDREPFLNGALSKRLGGKGWNHRPQAPHLQCCEKGGGWPSDNSLAHHNGRQAAVFRRNGSGDQSTTQVLRRTTVEAHGVSLPAIIKTIR